MIAVFSTFAAHVVANLMRKSILLLICILCWTAASSAQVSRSQARDAEWKNYALPQTNFARQIDAEKDIVFRVPADWKQADKALAFTGPHGATITVIVQKVPDGYPLLDYFGAILKIVRDQPDIGDAAIARKTQIQDLEAREIFLEAPDAEGEMIRSTTWITVNGPLAVSLNFKAPIAHAAEIEPVFKAVVQSVIFVPNGYPIFETLRSSTIKTPAPGPIHEIESIVASLSEVNADRESAVMRLASLFSSHADVTVDLLLDRRPLVRTAAVEALAKSNNTALTPILWELIDDREPFVAETAARAVATAPDVIAQTLKHSMSGFDTQTIARVWPFMPKHKRIELMQQIFSETAVPRSTAPPAVVRQTKPGVSVSVKELIALAPGQAPPPVAIALANDPNVQIGALTLLVSMPHEEFKLPLTRIMAAKYDPLIAVGLQVAHMRGESLPLDALFKLAASADPQVSKLAAQNLALSASIADIPRIESLISKDSAASKKALDDELKLSVKKIRFRQELTAAKSANEQHAIVEKALSDSSLADFAWRYHCEPTIAGCGTQPTLKRDLTIKPFGENLFPKKLQHYTAIPNPGQAVQKFYETLHELQLESPRAQSNLILTMGYLRQTIADQLSAPADADTLIEYTGIDPHSPIALGAWSSHPGTNRIAGADRKAIVLRVKDRGRFERAVERVQRQTENFMSLTDGVAIATRAAAALPAILPLSAQAALSFDPSKPPSGPLLKYDFVGEKEWNGFRVKTIEHVGLDSNWQIQSAATHMVFVGDTVILTQDLATIRELLNNANSQSDLLSDNPEFQKAIESRGDVVYFSDLVALMGDVFGSNKQPFVKANERGALNIAGSSWENSHQIVFDESDWAKPLLQFHPKELSSPRDLLPASTIAYYLMQVDLAGLWSTRAKMLFAPAEVESLTNVWALDFAKEVLPELGPECGAVMLELPKLSTAGGGSFAVFCKLKTNKLSEALRAGKLFRDVGPTNDFAEVKSSDLNFFVSMRNGFLVAANTAEGLSAFAGKTNLATTRDYSRAVEKVPSGIVAFGGYNLEAAIAAAAKTPMDGQRAEIAKLIFSVATAFHSQNFYATASAGTIEGRSSVAMDREGRYAVADVTFLPRGTNITFVTVEPAGIPITDQNRISSLVLKVKAKTAGPIDNIKDDIKTAEQSVEQKTANELLLTVGARRGGIDKPVELPVKDPAFEPYLKATTEFAADNKQVQDQAREIAGKDRDAWSVARKLADWTHKNLEWKQVVSASATQTLATREADCSEFSQLFVSMARSLGLPARMVQGLAYSGNSFGGHAWVEVWTGKWIELDPTWGTAFVDATHIRNASNALVTSAALSLIELEVLETKRTVTEFQKSSRALAEHLVKAIPGGEDSELEAAIDLRTLTDEFMGAGTWSKMNDGERDQMASAYRRVIKEIIEGYRSETTFRKMRLLHLQEKGDEAEALYITALSSLLKLRLVRRNEVWYLVEALQSDSGFHIVSDTLQPTIKKIQRSRAGEKAAPAALSDVVRILLLLNSNAAKAAEVADAALKTKPADQGIRFLKALALMRVKDREADAEKILRELANEQYGPALYRLADHLNTPADETKRRQAIDIYERYILIEPLDPRGYSELASVYHALNNPAKAEEAYKKAIECDPTNTDHYLALIQFLVVNDRIAETKPLLLTAEKYKAADEDVFGSAIVDLHIYEDAKNVEKFAASEPLRMKTSYLANYNLGQVHFDNKRYADALRLFEIAAQLDQKSPDPYVEMAMVYRRQSRWTAAVKAAQRAIDLNREDSEAHYQLACALARLGRTKEALAALTKSVELDPDQVDYIVDEADLKGLSSLPAFKKLISEPQKQ